MTEFYIFAGETRMEAAVWRPDFAFRLSPPTAWEQQLARFHAWREACRHGYLCSWPQWCARREL